MLQAVIGRLSSFGAMLKNYCITLTTAVAGFAVTVQRPTAALLAQLPVAVCALLDAQYLRNERRFRELFHYVRAEDWATRPSSTSRLMRPGPTTAQLPFAAGPSPALTFHSPSPSSPWPLSQDASMVASDPLFPRSLFSLLPPLKKRKAYFAFHFDDIMRVNNVRQAWKIVIILMHPTCAASMTAAYGKRVNSRAMKR